MERDTISRSLDGIKSSRSISMRKSVEATSSERELGKHHLNHLQLSNISCHEFCKYGKKHTSEEHVRSSSSVSKRHIFSPDNSKMQKGTATKNLAGRKNLLILKRRTGVKLVYENHIDIKKIEDRKNNTEIELKGSEDQVKLKHSATKGKNLVSKNKMYHEHKIEKTAKYTSIETNIASSINETCNVGKFLNLGIPSSSSFDISSKPVNVFKKTSSSARRITTSTDTRMRNTGSGEITKTKSMDSGSIFFKSGFSTDTGIRTETSRYSKPNFPGKNLNSVASSIDGDENINEKPVYDLKPKLESRRGESFGTKNTSASTGSSSPLSPLSTLPSTSSFSRSSHLDRGQKVWESNNSFLSDSDCYKNGDQGKNSEGERTKNTRGFSHIASEEIETFPPELKFKRGTTKLQLRPGRTKVRRKIDIETKKAGREDDISRNSTIEIIDKGPIVALRRQGVWEEKEEKGLLNLLIEETASKLAETRKSKVMALVAAFETVISLQERRPSSFCLREKAIADNS